MSGDVNAYVKEGNITVDNGYVFATQTYTNSVKTTTIALGSATSGSVDLGAWTYCAFVMPSAWTTSATSTPATLTFQTSTDDTTWGNLYDDYGNEVTCYATASYNVSLNTNLVNLLPWRYVKIRNGTSALPATQAAARTILFLVK